MLTRMNASLLLLCMAIPCMLAAMPAAAQGSDCPEAQQVCSLYHPGSLAMGGCEGPLCFNRSYAEAANAVAADDHGFFPKVWNLWTPGEVIVGSYLQNCEVEANGSSGNENKTIYKFKMLIPEQFDWPVCGLSIKLPGFIYHEHFGSNPLSGCLGWVECREPDPSGYASSLDTAAGPAE